MTTCSTPASRWSVSRKAVPLLAILALLCWIHPPPASAQASEEEARGLLDGLAALVYEIGWPTATYTGYRAGSLQRVPNGYDVTVRLEGISAFSGGPLWMELVLEFRNHNLFDVQVVRHNALLQRPFATAEAMGELLVVAAEALAGGPAVGLTPSDFGEVRAINHCDRSVSFALRFDTAEGGPFTGGWWNFSPGEDATLRSGDIRIRTRAEVQYVALTGDDQPARAIGHGEPSDWAMVRGEIHRLSRTVLRDSGEGFRVLEFTCSRGDSWY